MKQRRAYKKTKDLVLRPMLGGAPDVAVVFAHAEISSCRSPGFARERKIFNFIKKCIKYITICTLYNVTV